MTETSVETRQPLAAADAPGDEFHRLSWRRQREAFSNSLRGIQEAIVADMDRDQLYRIIRRLDPDEPTDVLVFADGGTRQAILMRLDDDRKKPIEFLLETVATHACPESPEVTGQKRSSAGFLALSWIRFVLRTGYSVKDSSDDATFNRAARVMRINEPKGREG